MEKKEGAPALCLAFYAEKIKRNPVKPEVYPDVPVDINFDFRISTAGIERR